MKKNRHTNQIHSFAFSELYQHSESSLEMNCSKFKSILKKNTNYCKKIILFIFTLLAISNSNAQCSFSSTITNVSCYGGNNGQVTLTGTGGASPYTYSFGFSSPFVSQNTFTNLAAGTYIVNVRDNTGCTSTKNVTVGQSTQIVANVTITPIAPNSVGGITSSVTGGVGPYTYLWSNGSTTPNITVVNQGVFSLNVTDSKGCTVAANAATGSYVPINSITGFNGDIVAEGTDADPMTVTNAGCDPDVTGTVMYANGYSNQYGETDPGGLPTNGILTNLNDANRIFNLAPYNVNNALVLRSQSILNGFHYGGSLSGTLSFGNQHKLTYNQLYVLCAASYGSGAVDYTLNFTDGTTQSGTFNAPDWFDNTSPVVSGLGRIYLDGSGFDGSTNAGFVFGNPRLYERTIAINPANQNKLVSHISMTYSNTAFGYPYMMGITALTPPNLFAVNKQPGNYPVCSPTSSNTNFSICSSALPYSWNGLTFNTAGSQTAHLSNACGSDSAATLNLTVKPNYTVTASAGSNGSISNSGVSTICNGNNSATYTITANAGYHIADVLVDGNSQGAITTYTFSNVTANHTISASFALSCSSSSSTTNTSICSSQLPYSWNGLTFNAAGTQTAHLTKADGCDSAASLTISLKTSPSIGVSVGGNICGIGGTLSVYNTNTLNGGVWSSSNTNVATISTASNGAGGLATGVNKGTVVLTYTKTSSANGCSASASCIVNVIAPTIIGAATICKGNTTQLSVTETGGYWASNNNKASVSSTGFVTGVNAGIASINYVVGGCVNTNTFTPTIVTPPAIPGISLAAGSINPQLGATPSSAYCNNKTFTLVGTPAGGVWSSTNSSVVTVSSGGVVNTVSVGIGSLVYTVTNASGCSNNRSIVGTVVGCAARGVNTVDGQQSTVNGFTMYPNPAKTFISINVETLIGKGIIVVTDLYGKTVKTQNLSMGTNTIDIANLSKGMYFVSMITSEGKITKKLVVE